MGTAVDLLRPKEGKTWCEMLTNHIYHDWSADGVTWRAPRVNDPATPSAYEGGSASYWPQNDVPADNRKYLSMWGYTKPEDAPGKKQKGGCCSASTTRHYQGWGQAFTMHFVYPMVEYPLVTVSGICIVRA